MAFAGKSPEAPAAKTQAGRRAVLLGACVLACAGAFWAVRTYRQGAALTRDTVPAPGDPRLSYAGPYRNIHPDVRYVGDAACEDCHQAETASYRRHPMGRSMAPTAQLAPRQPYDAAHHNPFDAFGTHFTVDRQGDRVWHRRSRADAAGRPVYETALEVHYVVGSGRRGYSYLTRRGAADGYLFQTPISWFAQKQAWDVSPGFSAPLLTGRPVNGECLFCHANRTHFVEGSENRYRPPVFDGLAIGCERCHGPGGRHVETQEPLDIVSPRKLEPELREAVCQQCHLEGAARVTRRGRERYDFRPGLPFDAFWAVFIRSHEGGADAKAVNHVEQMYQSRCFRESTGAKKLGCLSCHEPHRFVGPDERTAYYRRRCLECHESQGCTLPQAARLARNKEDSCIDCHMPRYSAADVAHIASTDHRIVRRPKDADETAIRHPQPAISLAPFPGRPRDFADEEGRRDIGIALIQAASNGHLPTARAAAQADELLAATAHERPDDVEAGEARGWALALQNRPREALAAFAAVLAQAPDREHALVQAAGLARDLRQTDAALDYWRRAVSLNPWMPGYRKQLALLLRERNAWDDVRRECRAWLELDPGSSEARTLRVMCLLEEGKTAEARAEFARVEALQPPNLAALRAWFAKQAR